MGSAIVQKGSRHGYSTLVTETDMAKATLRMEIELAYDIHQNRQKQNLIYRHIYRLALQCLIVDVLFLLLDIDQSIVIEILG